MPPTDQTKDYVEISHRGGHVVAKVVVPSVGQNEAPVIREQVVAAMASAPRGRALVLDFSQVSLITSIGLGTCVDLRNCADKAGLRSVAYGMNRHLVDVFRMMRIERLFTILKTPQELDQLLGS